MNKGARLGFIIGGSIVVVFSSIALWADPFLSTLGEHNFLAGTIMQLVFVMGIVGVVAGIRSKSKKDDDEDVIIVDMRKRGK